MDVLAFIKELFASGLSTLAQAGAKAVTGTGKDISGAAKDVTGIRRDLIETQLAGKKLEDLERMIQEATLEDVERFCPRTLKVIVKAKRAARKEYNESHEWLRIPDDRPKTVWRFDPDKERREYLTVLNGYSEMVWVRLL